MVRCSRSCRSRRVRHSAHDIESRAASIRAKGLLQPLVAIVRGAPYAAWSLLR